MVKVKLKEPQSTNLCGLFIKYIIDENLKKFPEKEEKIKKLNGTILIKAGKMKVLLSFKDGEITIENGEIENPTAYVEGSLEIFLKIAVKEKFIMPIITRQIKFKGNFSLLWGMLCIIRI